jgi:ATP-dependent RNA helicase DeaD
LTNFSSLGISESIVSTLIKQGIAVPTPIQEQAIPLVLAGKDVIAQSQTGTGKTFAFILPILERVDPTSPHIQALIVTPTRELALQITNEIKKLIEDQPDIRVLAIYGGQDVESQLKKLKSGRHIVIGTPGRLLDHIRRETVDFSKTNFLVLDEADQMLHIGFLPEVERIIEETPSNRQTMLFSATMPDEIKRLAQRHMRNAQNIQVEKTQAPLDNIKQMAISTVDRAKQGDLIDLLHLYQPFLGVIFCRTKRRVTKLYEALKENGFNCDQLHGDLSQAKREQVMKRFRKAEIQFLIATDVAARGLDVEGVTHVFNYDIPEDTESYIHRIGRTGRAGGQGLAITLYSPKDRDELIQIEKELNMTIPKKNIGNAKKHESEDREEGNDSTSNAPKKRARRGKNERNANRRGDLVKKQRQAKEDSSRNNGERPKRFDVTRDSMDKKRDDRNEGTHGGGRPHRESRQNRDRRPTLDTRQNRERRPDHDSRLNREFRQDGRHSEGGQRRDTGYNPKSRNNADSHLKDKRDNGGKPSYSQEKRMSQAPRGGKPSYGRNKGKSVGSRPKSR